jgi:hypothetical protein
MQIIDNADERALFRHPRQQAEHGQANEELIRRLPGIQPERRAQRSALRVGQTPEAIQEWRAQLMKTGIRQLHFGLDSHRSRDPASRALRRQVPEQGGLADPASPRTTSTWLWPARTYSSSRSSASHSLRRPCRSRRATPSVLVAGMRGAAPAVGSA